MNAKARDSFGSAITEAILPRTSISSYDERSSSSTGGRRAGRCEGIELRVASSPLPHRTAYALPLGRNTRSHAWYRSGLFRGRVADLDARRRSDVEATDFSARGGGRGGGEIRTACKPRLGDHSASYSCRCLVLEWSDTGESTATARRLPCRCRPRAADSASFTVLLT